MILRIFVSCAASAAALSLAGCNASAPAPQAAAPPARASATNPAIGANLPAGASCAAAIDRYQKIATSDYKTGNVNASVYKQIEAELTKASAACAAGKDGEALALVHASERKHGYPG